MNVISFFSLTIIGNEEAPIKEKDTAGGLMVQFAAREKTKPTEPLVVWNFKAFDSAASKIKKMALKHGDVVDVVAELKQYKKEFMGKDGPFPMCLPAFKIMDIDYSYSSYVKKATAEADQPKQAVVKDGMLDLGSCDVFASQSNNHSFN